MIHLIILFQGDEMINCENEATLIPQTYFFSSSLNSIIFIASTLFVGIWNDYEIRVLNCYDDKRCEFDIIRGK